MFGIDKNTLIKHRILLILDNNNEFVSTTELANQIECKSHATIRKICAELKDDIQENYSKKEVEFISNKHYGNKLILHTVNVQNITTLLYSKDINFEILTKLFYYKEISTYDFCTEHYLSESQLRRKIKSINEILDKYKIKVTVSDKIKLVGSEHIIIAFHFVLIYYFYSFFAKINFLDNDKELIRKTMDTLDYLNIEYDENTLKMATIMYFIISKSNELEQEFDEEYIHNYLDGIKVMEKPSFLDSLSEPHWKFLNLTLYTADLYNFEIGICDDLKKRALPNEDVIHWVDSFEKHFRKLSEAEVKYLNEILFKIVMSNETILTYNTMLMLLDTINIDDLNFRYPQYMKTFENFWNDYACDSILTNELVMIESLLICIKFVPLGEIQPIIKAYLYTNTSPLFTVYLKSSIKTRFSNKYNIEFTDTQEESDLIIVTTGNLVENIEEKNLVVIDSKISYNDYNKISDEINKFLKLEDKNIIA